MLHHMVHRARMALHVTAAAVLGAALAGCSSSNPAGPSPGFDPAQFLRPGEYRLLVLTSSQQATTCTRLPTQLPQPPLFAITAAVTVSRDGDTWTARSKAAADGDFELRLRRGADGSGTSGPVLLINVEGTGRGTAVTSVSGTASSSVSFGGPAGESRFEGRALFQGSAQGTATGAVSVNSEIFGSLECPAVSWTLVPLSPASL